MGGPGGLFCEQDRRILAFSFNGSKDLDGGVKLSSVWDKYYDSLAKYKRLQEIKMEVDPDGVFSPNAFGICSGPDSDTLNFVSEDEQQLDTSQEDIGGRILTRDLIKRSRIQTTAKWMDIEFQRETEREALRLELTSLAKSNNTSTFQWLIESLNTKKLREALIRKYESAEYVSKGDRDENPVNILVIDGGGMKAYATLAMLESIQIIMQQNHNGEDFISCFDLFAGTSAGGCLALGESTKTLDEAIADAREVLGWIRSKSMVNANICMGNMWRLAKKGSILNKRSQIQTLVKKKYKEQPLYRDANTKPKVFAMSLEHNETTNTYEPLLLRTYDHRPDETPITKGISNIKLWQAVSATCAIPGVYDQVKVKLDGASLSLVDGGLLANCPIESAIDEARRLFPNRRLGVVLSLGLDPTQTVYANRASYYFTILLSRK